MKDNKGSSPAKINGLLIDYIGGEYLPRRNGDQNVRGLIGGERGAGVMKKKRVLD